MVDKASFSKNLISQEFSAEQSDRWFKMKKEAYLHTIDTFYYSIKVVNDLTKGSVDVAAVKLRSYFDHRMERLQETYEPQFLDIPGCRDLYLVPGSYSKYYKIHIQYADIFDVFIAPVVPPDKDGVLSITPEVIVQLRSYNLWLYSVHGAFQSSYSHVCKILDYFGLEVMQVVENRCDFCWHTNALSSPEKFFEQSNFAKMQCSHFRSNLVHYSFVGEDDYEVDYIALGKRSGKVFVRIYLKSKEVVEKGYKAFFFKAWKLHGLVNDYDVYCLEKAYVLQCWDYLDIARMEFYLEYGQNEGYKQQCRVFIKQFQEGRRLTDQMRCFADRITPPVTKIINVEFQLMRKASKSFELIDKDKKIRKIQDVEQFLQNLPIVADYLTSSVLRLVDPKDPDSHKYRRQDCYFWKRLRQCKGTYDIFEHEDLEIVRKYQRNLNAELMRRQLLQKSVVYGFYSKGVNQDSPLQDAFDGMMQFNDNDICYARVYKERKARNFRNGEFTGLVDNTKQHSIRFLDSDGCIYDKDTLEDLVCQDGNEKGGVDW